MKDLQRFVDGYGFGISVQKLAAKAYWQMQSEGHQVCMVNERYLEVDGTKYYFSKSRKQGGWIVKEF